MIDSVHSLANVIETETVNVEIVREVQGVMKKRYGLEIYHPDGHNVLESFESNNPFMVIARGDIVNPNLWELAQSSTKGFRVTGVEHLIWRGRDRRTRHKVMLFTEEAPLT